MAAAPTNVRQFHQDASIVLVGCRGAGKRSLGFIGALHLRRRLVTEDHYFQQVTGTTRTAYLTQHGKEAFARQISEVFKRMLDDNRKKCIIECGMSSFSEDAQSCLRSYSESNPVIYIHREKEEILRLLDSADGERILRADRSHRSCSNLEYYNLYDPSGVKPFLSPDSNGGGWDSQLAVTSSLLNAKQDFTRFLDFVTGQGLTRAWLESPFSIRAIPPEYRQYSYALRLRVSYLVDMDLEWEDFEARGDCVELVIDHWPTDLSTFIARQVALIRRKLAVPIIFHVEENPRDEPKRSAEDRKRMDTELLELGLRLGVDYLSIDLQRTDIPITHLLEHRGRSKIIGNFWNLGLATIPWSDESQVENYKYAQSLGCDIVRMVRFCSGDSTNEMLTEFRDKIQALIPDPKPVLVAYDFSVLGVRTPLQGRVLNPVKHPDLENLRDHLATVCTAHGSFELLFRQFELEPLQFYTLGANVSYSLSPYMHNAAYEYTGMPHNFQAVQCMTTDDLNIICSDANFGGALLTAPFKVAIVPHLKLKSHHASVIGAVNVLLPLRGKTSFILDHANSRNKSGRTNEFYGDNTDWQSIFTCLRRAISPRNFVRASKTTGLVIGAGGMARAAIYALIQLGCRNIFVHNRTVENAQRVADHFNSWAAANGTVAAGKYICHVLGSVAQPWPPSFQPPTLIVSCVPTTSVDGNPPADFEMPLQWLGSPTGGVVLELAYEPLITPLVAQMQVFRDTVSPSWVVVDGLENLGEMAIEAFELMTGRLAPRRLMKDVCRRTWEQHRRDFSSMS
ncbi:putative repressor protein [Phaeoacremonium minimum UCRPA7]|uniref:Putative repressor protein n=1 Tax=Phaeoacremonium minimum (strain UCR-PA7) TaxID=1286976 RepID=R8BXD0_PHAM7|nr:putative repressor protein [Phaeoacremonium minimum UCRPA7]EOO03985.1 putative repressor protein [Phaeoacremonium minimum UCRPA7]